MSVLLDSFVYATLADSALGNIHFLSTQLIVAIISIIFVTFKGLKFVVFSSFFSFVISVERNHIGVVCNPTDNPFVKFLL